MLPITHIVVAFPAIPNDFKYKFSWSPVGVIKALNNDAKFINNFQTVVKTPYKKYWEIFLLMTRIYEAHPNRPQLHISKSTFDQQWKLQRIQGRGTLRLKWLGRCMERYF